MKVGKQEKGRKPFTKLTDGHRYASLSSAADLLYAIIYAGNS